MAQSLRRPLLGLAQHISYSPIPSCTRAFSTTLPALGTQKGVPGNSMPRIPAQRDVRLQSREEGYVANDMGLLPGTFIWPVKKPSIASKPYWTLQYERYKTLGQNWLVLALYKFANRKYGFKFGFPSRKPVAQALHKQMYGAFAAADTTTLRRITCDGLYESFSSRIYSRPKFERWEWELVKYNGRPKVVSDRAASLGIEGCGIRQVVVRIPSRQRLTRYNRRGEVVEGTGKEKDTVEFVVIQKKLWHGKEEDWRVWGTTEETTYERVLENRKKELD